MICFRNLGKDKEVEYYLIRLIISFESRLRRLMVLLRCLRSKEAIVIERAKTVLRRLLN